MAQFADRVQETTTTTGTGNLTLSGTAPSGYRTLTSMGYAVGTTRIPYAIQGQTGTEWEVGLGTYLGTNSFARTLVTASSNPNALVNFSAGTKDFWIDIPADWARDMTSRGRTEMMRIGAFSI